MNPMKPTLWSGLLALAVTTSAPAAMQTINWTSGFANGGAIPDANPGGWSDTRSVSLFGSGYALTDVNVTLTISGGFNGDLYAYLSHSGGFTVLLNRVGRTSSSSFGYGDAGLSITLDDQASTTTDIHLYQTVGGYSISGGVAWRPDGRNVDPVSVLDTDSRTRLLSQMSGLDPNGSWTLFIADLSGGGGTSLVTSWGLELTAVPEPTHVALGVFGALFAGAHLWRWARRRVRAAA
jgi:subtilisin-like proprotein convertase family protein